MKAVGAHVLTGLLVTLAGLAAASPPNAEPGPLRSSRLLGDPWGARSRLEQLGVDLQLFYNQVLAGKPDGDGVRPEGEFGYSGSYDFFALVDVEELVGWPDLDLFLHVKGQYDENVNAAVGALADPIDDADFDEPIYVAQLWLEQAFLRDRVRLRLGYLDSQTLYDRNAFANSEDRQFLSAALDNNLLVPLPNGLSAALIVAPWSWLELALGAADADNVPFRVGFDTAFDSLASVTGYVELTAHTRLASARGELPGSYRAGVFLDGRRLAVFGETFSSGAARTERGHLGAYLSFDQLVWREREASAEGVGLFARFGYADPDVNRIKWFWSAGFEAVGALPRRDGDTLGMGVYQAIGSRRYRNRVEATFGRETGFELYYRIAVLPWFAITPDFQYIADPGGRASVNDAIVGALRFRVSF